MFEHGGDSLSLIPPPRSPLARKLVVASLGSDIPTSFALATGAFAFDHVSVAAGVSHRISFTHGITARNVTSWNPWYLKSGAGPSTAQCTRATVPIIT